jgi:hypothetical protein
LQAAWQQQQQQAAQLLRAPVLLQPQAQPPPRQRLLAWQRSRCRLLLSQRWQRARVRRSRTLQGT